MSIQQITIADAITGQPVSGELAQTVRVAITPSVLTTISHVVSAPVLRPSASGKVMFVLNALAILRYGSVVWDLTGASCNLALAPPGADLNTDDPFMWLGTFVAPAPAADIVSLASTRNLGGATAMARQSGGLDLFSNGSLFINGDGDLDLYITYIEV